MPGAPQPRRVSDEPTLDAFADGSDDDGGDAGVDAKRDDSDAAVGGGADDVDPLAVTSAYRPDGECASCGASSTRLWLASEGGDDSGGRVCAGCAGWATTGGRAADQ